MAAFTNLALSASQLGTQYLNKLFVVERGHYDELGMLMIVTTILGLVLPVTAVLVFHSRGRDKWRWFFRRLKEPKVLLPLAGSQEASR
jgi:H+/Cl- antiporter ClcA